MSNMTLPERAPPAGRSAAEIRDLSLVLFGVALGKVERQRVLDSVPRNMLTKEFLSLFDALREQKVAPVSSWFSDRGASVEGGKDVIQAAIDSLNTESHRQKVLRVLETLRFAREGMDTDELVVKLRDCADVLEGKKELPEVKL